MKECVEQKLPHGKFNNFLHYYKKNGRPMVALTNQLFPSSKIYAAIHTRAESAL